jgi:aryl-alcohol dehydrogenase-like predicted oxidoreductase
MMLKKNGLALGTWLFGGSGWQANPTQREVTELVLTAFEDDIQIIDTAPAYGRGKSETLLAEPLKKIRDDIILVTKCGLSWDEHGRFKKDHSKKTILHEITQSLKRMQVDTVDLLLIHWPDKKTSVEETCDGLSTAKEKGYAIHVGFSNGSLTELDKIKNKMQINALQDPCNLAQPLPQPYLDFISENKIWTMGYSPLAQGLLTGKYSECPKLPKKDFRNLNPLFFEPHFSKVQKLNTHLTTLIPEMASSLSDLALRYVQSICNCAVVGVRNKGQLQEILKSNHKKLSQDALLHIKETQNKHLKS